MANAFIPNNDKLPVVNHKDLNRSNNNADNLEWATYQENTLHYYEEKRKENYVADHGYRGHIKVYARSVAELEEFKRFAKSKGFSASSWMRGLAVNELSKNSG